MDLFITVFKTDNTRPKWKRYESDRIKSISFITVKGSLYDPKNKTWGTNVVLHIEYKSGYNTRILLIHNDGVFFNNTHIVLTGTVDDLIQLKNLEIEYSLNNIGN